MRWQWAVLLLALMALMLAPAVASSLEVSEEELAVVGEAAVEEAAAAAQEAALAETEAEAYT